MTKRTLHFILLLMLLSLTASAKSYLLTQHQAVDTTGQQLASPALNALIARCSSEGGGRVVVPQGRYLCGTILMRSGVELHLQQGAQIIASLRTADFPTQPRNHARSQKDKDGWYALIYAADARNIAITGKGIIDGRGAEKREILRREPGDIRPRNILFISCNNVTVEGITIKNSPTWNQHYFNCEDLTIQRILSWNHCNGNNDGIDIDGCRRVTIQRCTVDSEDDGIVLKSTSLAASEDILISRCTVSSFANAIKVGTETVGTFRNIKVHRCQVRPSSHTGERVLKTTKSGINALSLEMVDGGELADVEVNGLDIVGTECAIFVRLANRGRNQIDGVDMPEARPGKLHNVVLKHIHATDVGNFGSSITGIPSACVENVTLHDVSIQSRGGLMAGNYRQKDANHEKRHDMVGNNHADQYWATADDVVEGEKSYPQPTLWGNLPCYGLFVRHARNIRLKKVSFSTEKPDPRQQMLFVDVAPALH